MIDGVQQPAPVPNVQQNAASPAPKSKKSAPPKKRNTSKPEGSSGVTPIMRAQENEVKVVHTPERTYYLLNVHCILQLAAFFELFVRLQPRPRPGHEPGNYASAFIMALICKLTRVANHTNQFRLSSVSMPSPLHLKLPPFLCNLIDCFGEFINPESGVVHAPYITTESLKYLYHLADLLYQANTVNDVNFLLDVANHRKYLLQCYGRQLVHYLGMCQLHDVLGIGPYTATRLDDQHQRVATALSVVTANIVGGVAIAAGDVTATIGAAAPNGPHSSLFVGGAYLPALAPVIQLPAPAIVSANAVRANIHGPNWEFLAGVPIPIPAAPFNAGTYPGGFAAVAAYEADATFLEKIFVVATPSIQPFGNAAPTGVVQNTGPYCSVSTSLHCITAKEGVMAAIINCNFVCWVNARGVPYDLRDLTRTSRTTVQGIDENGQSLLAKALKESLILKK